MWKHDKNDQSALDRNRQVVEKSWILAESITLGSFLREG